MFRFYGHSSRFILFEIVFLRGGFLGKRHACPSAKEFDGRKNAIRRLGLRDAGRSAAEARDEGQPHCEPALSWQIERQSYGPWRTDTPGPEIETANAAALGEKRSTCAGKAETVPKLLRLDRSLNDVLMRVVRFAAPTARTTHSDRRPEANLDVGPQLVTHLRNVFPHFTAMTVAVSIDPIGQSQHGLHICFELVSAQPTAARHHSTFSWCSRALLSACRTIDHDVDVLGPMSPDGLTISKSPSLGQMPSFVVGKQWTERPCARRALLNLLFCLKNSKQALFLHFLCSRYDLRLATCWQHADKVVCALAEKMQNGIDRAEVPRSSGNFPPWTGGRGQTSVTDLLQTLCIISRGVLSWDQLWDSRVSVTKSRAETL